MWIGQVPVGLALLVVAEGVVALADALERVIAPLAHRDPPQVVALPADRAEPGGAQRSARCQLLELVDLVACVAHRVADLGQDADRAAPPPARHPRRRDVTQPLQARRPQAV